jgi:hypothetical protein
MYVKYMEGEGPTTFYAYPGDDAREIIYQEGLRVGYKFRYNELVGYKKLT